MFLVKLENNTDIYCSDLTKVKRADKVYFQYLEHDSIKEIKAEDIYSIESVHATAGSE